MKQLLWLGTALLIITAGCKKDDAKSTAAVTTGDVSDVTANTATAGGNVTGDGGSGVTKRGVCYAIHPAPTVSDSVTSDGGGTGLFTSSLTNLYSYTKYYVRAYAINASGTAYGNETNFTTATGVPSVITTAVTGIVPLKAMGGGNVVSDGGSTVTARGIVWSLTEHPTIDNFKTTDGTGVGTFTDSLYPLGSQKIYYYRAYATNGSGTGYGVEMSFTSVSADAVTDIDGNTYGYITIGTQSWFTSNLKVAHYRNGDPITDGFANNGAWYLNNWSVTVTTGAYTYPNDSLGANDKYGKFYDNIVIVDPRQICPTGWHIPTDEEWKTLEVFEGMSSDDANTSATSNRGSISSKFLEGGSSGLNLQLSGAVGLPVLAQPAYADFRKAGFYWTSTFVGSPGPGDLHNAYWMRGFNYPGDDPGAIQRNYNLQSGFSVRCVKDL